uniref:OSDLc n=1 Tax=Dianthus caryophyllus TaxID=3570 RepID=A0A221LEJ5_DIACA|nr:OSDLc [Dianthus caryophyllus]
MGVEGGEGVQRLVNGRGHDRQTTAVTARRGDGDDGRGNRGQLPSWYPRTPLRDITDIMRAIERRRAELGLNQDSETPEAHDNAANPEVDRELVVSTPMPTIVVKPRLSPAAQLSIMKAITAECSVDNFDSLTPQKQLLNSIEKVRQVWVHQRLKLEKTPCARRVERENKMRVLMSMR